MSKYSSMRLALIAAVCFLFFAVSLAIVGVSMAQDYHIKQLYHVSIQLEQDYKDAAMENYILPGMFQRRNQWLYAMQAHVGLSDNMMAECWDAYPMVEQEIVPGMWISLETAIQLSDCNYELAVRVHHGNDDGVRKAYGKDLDAWWDFRDQYEEEIRQQYQGSVYQG